MGARGSCNACSHPRRDAINAAKAGGMAVATIARTFGVATTTLVRHFRHVGPARKAVYERLHPEAKEGAKRAAGMNRKLGRGDVDEIISPTFTADTHAKTGLSQRTIQHEVQIGSMPEAPARYQSGPTRGSVPFTAVKEAAALLGVPLHELAVCLSEHSACDITVTGDDEEESLYAEFDLADEDPDYVADVARHGLSLATRRGSAPRSPSTR